MIKKHVDILIEVPYLWMHDGYGHSAPEVINMVGRFADENNLTWAVLRAHVLTNITNLDPMSKNIVSHFINAREVDSSEILFRYHYPKESKGNAKKLVSYTMFETDKCPDAWVDILNASDLVLVPNNYLQNIFQSALTTRVETLLLPLHDEYYNLYSNDELLKSLPEKISFSFVGTANESNDRKGIVELCNLYSKYKLSNNATFIVKSRNFNKSYKNIVIQQPNKSIQSLVPFYLSSHAGIYPSRGEGYGLPQLETAILGRPIIVADNSSMSWAKEFLPWVIPVKCTPKPALYSSRVPGDVGNWGYCNMEEVLNHMDALRNYLEIDKSSYHDKIIESHNSASLRDIIDKEKIYTTLSKQLTKVLEGK